MQPLGKSIQHLRYIFLRRMANEYAEPCFDSLQSVLALTLPFK